MTSVFRLIAISMIGIGTASAQTYPVKPIRMIIGFAPGGGTDQLGRLVAQKLAEPLGQQIIVDNRAGASGQIAAELVAKSPPDGYTICMASVGTFAILPALLTKLPFDVERDFSPITLVGSGPNLLVVHPSLPVKTVKELIALAKARPGQLQYASPGAGTSNHVAAEYFKTQTKTDILHVPYKGSGQSLIDLISGQVHINFDSVPAVNAYVQQGKLRAIAVTSPKRFSVLPDIPTMEESGVPGFNMTTWWGLVAPAGLSKEIVARIHTETVKLLRQTDIKERIAFLGGEPVGNSPEEFAAFIRGERDKYVRIAKAANIKID